MVNSKKSYGLVADVGGTNIRFGVVDLSDRHCLRVEALRLLATADYGSFGEAARAYLADVKAEGRLMGAVFAAAGPSRNGEIALINSRMRLVASELAAQLGVSVRLINDYEAIALAVPRFESRDLIAIGPQREFVFGRADGETIAIIGPGTGLGVAGLVRWHGENVPLVTEGGHASLAPIDKTEIEILQVLMRRFEHVSAERVLSGPGLCNLYNALAEIEGVPQGELKPEEITAEAERDGSSFCARVFARFSAMLGSYCANMALIFGARGGVMIAGGILPAVSDLFAASPFRENFEAKGRFHDYLKSIPTYLIVHTHAALLGAASLLKSK